MNINGKWMSEPEVQAYVSELENKIKKYDKAICGDIELIDYLRTMPQNRWISVKDRLPDENQKCLVYRDINADLKITTGIWHSEWKAFDGLRHGTRLEDTIAWMPLPEPPKE